MISIVAISFLTLGLSLAIAITLLRRGRAFAGVVLGLAPPALMELGFHWSLQARIRDCIDRACASAGLAPGCEMAQFGCTEWSGLSFFVFWVAGLSVVLLYLIGVVAYAVVRARRGRARRGNEPPPTNGQAAA